MSQHVRTKRWNDPVEPEDGRRILVCRYRPRGLKKEKETWDQWVKELGPSPQLLKDFQGKEGVPITWAEFKKRYLAEMKNQQDAIGELSRLVNQGETITILCSASCVDETRCHRSLLRELIYKATA